MSTGEQSSDDSGGPERAVGRIVDGSEFIMETLELLTGVVLIVLFAIGLYDLVRQIWVERATLFGDIGAVLQFIDTVLLLLVIVEVFRTVVAFSREETIVRIIIDASLVAIARKIIGFDSSPSNKVDVLLSALSIAVLFLAVVTAYYVVRQVSIAVDESARMHAAGGAELSVDRGTTESTVGPDDAETDTDTGADDADRQS